jgi:hypothetical protein
VANLADTSAQIFPVRSGAQTCLFKDRESFKHVAPIYEKYGIFVKRTCVCRQNISGAKYLHCPPDDSSE